MSQHEGLSRWLSAGRRRLRVRAAWRGSAVGAITGGVVALVSVPLARLVGAVDVPTALALALGLPIASALAGGLIAGARWSVDRRGVALVLDKVGGTDERLITAVHLAEGLPGDPRTRAALGALDQVEIDELARRLPVRWPRLARGLPLLVAVSVGLAFLPAGALSSWAAWAFDDAPRSALSEAGERLADRLAEIEPPPEAPAWPEDVARRVEELAEQMKAGEISEAEAAEALERLAQNIEALGGALADARDALDALEEAAEQLDAPATDGLRDALQSGDPGAAERAARDLQESLSGADPATRAETAEAMRQAGEQLARSGDPALSGAGEALQEAARRAAQGGEISPEQARELAEQLRRAREAGEQMQRDAEALERAQRLAGAVESARQQIGEGDPAGQSSQGGGEGQGSGQSEGGESGGSGEGADGPGPGGPGGQGADGSGSDAGADHTWEDQGESSGGASAGGREDRASNRRDGRHIDDFEQLYAPVRIEGAEALVAGTNSQLNEDGRVDELEYRLTTAEESARAGRVDLPESYREAASAAIDAEPIPPAYRSAVRDYFGEME